MSRSAGDASAAEFIAEMRTEIIGTGITCTAGTFLAGLDPDAQAAVIAALNEGIPATAITRWLRKRGYPGKEQSVNRHLKGRCECPAS